MIDQQLLAHIRSLPPAELREVIAHSVGLLAWMENDRGKETVRLLEVMRRVVIDAEGLIS